MKIVEKVDVDHWMIYDCRMAGNEYKAIGDDWRPDMLPGMLIRIYHSHDNPPRFIAESPATGQSTVLAHGMDADERDLIDLALTWYDKPDNYQIVIIDWYS